MNEQTNMSNRKACATHLADRSEHSEYSEDSHGGAGGRGLIVPAPYCSLMACCGSDSGSSGNSSSKDPGSVPSLVTLGQELRFKLSPLGLSKDQM